MESNYSPMGNPLKLFIIGFSFLLLGACTKAGDQLAQVPKDFYLYKSSTNYHIAVPNGFTYNEPAPSGKYYYFGYPSSSSTGLHTVELYDSSLSSCEPASIGSSKLEVFNAENKTVWGKIDYFDIYPDLDFPGGVQPVCRPANENGSTAYALCANKNDKVVLICVSEAIDNPGLAEQVFKTFKWTE